MLQNAQYSVWFRTPVGEGHGIISLMDGDVSGGDNIVPTRGATSNRVINLRPLFQSSGIRKGRLPCWASTMLT